MIRIGVVMGLGSPWQRDAALRIAQCGMETHAIVVASKPQRHYLSSVVGYDDSILASLRHRLASIHLLRTRLNSDLRHLPAARLIRAVHREKSIDLLLLLGGGGFALAAYLSGVRPYVVYTVGSDVLAAHGWRRRLNRITYRAATSILANGQFLAEQAKTLTSRDDVRYSCLGIDPDVFVPQRLPLSSMRILCTRTFSRTYNNEYLIEAMHEVGNHAHYDDVVFTADGPLLQRARDAAKCLPPEIAARLRFLGGVSDREMLDCLQSSSIYVSLSRTDGTSISLLEALSCGVFPVVSDIPQNREWIEPDLQNGILVPLDQPKLLARALERALTDRALRVRAAEVNREIVLSRGDARKTMAELATHLRELLQTSRS
jgi:glycosyltransferase involved in cell wall biosynthesis